MGSVNCIEYDDKWILENWDTYKNWLSLCNKYNEVHGSHILYRTFKSHCNRSLGLNFKYTQEQKEFLKSAYPKYGMPKTAQMFNARFNENKTERGIKVQCIKLGLLVTPERKEQYRKERTEHFSKPVGSMTTHRGEKLIKTENGWVYEKYLVYGEVPNGYSLVHLDGDLSNNNLDNLMAVKRDTLARMTYNKFWSKDAELTKTGIMCCKLENALKKKESPMNYAQMMEKERKIQALENTIRDIGDASYEDLANLTGCTKITIARYVKELSERNDRIKVIAKHGGRGGGGSSIVRWVHDSTTEKKEDEPVKDPTATAAMNNVQPSAGKFKEPVKPGDIWWLDATPAYMALVLSVNKTSAQTLLVKDVDNYYDPEMDMSLSINDKKFYISPYKVMSRSTRTFINKAATFGSDRLTKVLQAVGYYLYIPPVYKEVVKEVPVEKIVEKTVEVPVEHVVVKEVPSADPILLYKAELWDRYVESQFGKSQN